VEAASESNALQPREVNYLAFVTPVFKAPLTILTLYEYICQVP
jgi:hypothetical protein